MKNSISPDVLIIGSGGAGLVTAWELAQKISQSGIDGKIFVIGATSGNSVMSTWSMIRQDSSDGLETLKKRLLENAGDDVARGRRRMLEFIADNHVTAVDRFFAEVVTKASLGTKGGSCNVARKNLCFGVRPDAFLPGKAIMDELKRQILAFGNTEIFSGHVTNIEDVDGSLAISCKIKDVNYTWSPKKLVVAAGGRGHLMDNTTGQKSLQMPNILDMVAKAGIAIEGLDDVMIHPTMLTEGQIVRGLISGPWIVNSDFLLRTNDGKLQEFLPNSLADDIRNNNYHHKFDEFAASMRDGMERGEIILRSRMTQGEFEAFKSDDPYGYVFTRICSIEDVRELQVKLGYHYTLGGVVIGESCRSTSRSGVFAIGESASLYGKNRIGGMGHVDSITLAPLIAEQIVNDLSKELRVTPKYSMSPLPGALSV